MNISHTYNQIMLRLHKILTNCCSTIKQQLPKDIQPVFWYYKSGKSIISISQNIVSLEQVNKKLFPNYFIHQDLCFQLQKQNPQLYLSTLQSKQINGHTLLNVFRLLVTSNIANKDIGFDINKLKANKYIQKLIQFKQTGKVVTKTSQIIIDQNIQQKINSKILQILQPNVVYLQKLIQTGLGLPISFLISKQNVSSSSWLKLLAKKRKAIHSDIIQTLQLGPQKKPICLQQFVYNHGFKLQHLFLKPYSKGQPIGLLSQNDSFNLEQLLKVLSIIDFQGKVVLQNTQNFAQNIQFLDATLKRCGYQKKKSGEIDLINQYMIF